MLVSLSDTAVNFLSDVMTREKWSFDIPEHDIKVLFPDDVNGENKGPQK